MNPRRLLPSAPGLLVLAGSLLFVVFGASFAIPAVRARLLDGAVSAWILSALVLMWFAAHLFVKLRSRREGSAPDPGAELAFELRHGRGPGHWRDRLLRRGRPAGQSHSGERPRFD